MTLEICKYCYDTKTATVQMFFYQTSIQIALVFEKDFWRLWLKFLRNRADMIRTCAMVRLYFNVGQWQPSQEQWILAGNCVQEEERKRISRFVFKEDCKRALIGRVLLRFSICKSLNVPWTELKLTRTEKGKPVLDLKNVKENLSAELSKISFNISHSGDHVVAVTCEKFQTGVDVMNIKDKHGDIARFFQLMKRNFTEREWSCIKSQSDDDARMKMFYRHWCLKESFVKAIGKGIGYSLQRLCFEVDPDSETQPGRINSKTKLEIDGVQSTKWIFEETMIDNEHSVAIATEYDDSTSSDCRNDPKNELFIEVTFSDFEQYFQKLSDISNDFWEIFDKKVYKHR